MGITVRIQACLNSQYNFSSHETWNKPHYVNEVPMFYLNYVVCAPLTKTVYVSIVICTYASCKIFKHTHKGSRPLPIIDKTNDIYRVEHTYILKYIVKRSLAWLLNIWNYVHECAIAKMKPNISYYSYSIGSQLFYPVGAHPALCCKLLPTSIRNFDWCFELFRWREFGVAFLCP